MMAILGLTVVGCEDNTDAARKIRMAESRRKASETEGVDHLAETFSLIDQLVSLNPDAARRQIKFHLGQWSNAADTSSWDIGKLPASFDDVRDTVGIEELEARFADRSFSDRDIDRLRDAALYRDIVAWVDRNQSASVDPILEQWISDFESKNQTGDRSDADQLATASRLFDWITRNVCPQPLRPQFAVTAPEMPDGLEYLGPGYRQSSFQTIFRGSGDWYARAIVFCRLCQQANLSAAIIATSSAADDVSPWCVGVLIGEDMFLFEFNLGIHIPGPSGVGIATLRQARNDESILRRMNVPGFFDYPLSKDDVQSCIALVPVTPEDAAPRLKYLQDALTGELRIKAHVDLPSLVKKLDAASGVADVRLWDVLLKVQPYQDAIERGANRDPALAYVERGQWMMLESDVPAAKQLAIGRLRQLRGEFDDQEMEDRQGARSLLLAQRQPEFEISDLQTDPELQKKYDVRRMLGLDESDYQRQLAFVQQLLRAGKRTATFWIASLQYDDQKFDNAEDWFTQRVLDEKQPFIWTGPANYSLARTYEKLGKIDKAIEIYKTRGLPNEHGHRLRARLLQASQSDE